MAGFAPIPVKIIYAATISAIIFFRYQLRKYNISVSCLCPGPIFTKPEIQKETIKKLGWFGKQMAVSSEKVGEIAVRRTLKRKMLIIPGILASTLSIFLRLLPKRLISLIYCKLSSDTV
jgi:short-subunit dehydrogenase